MSYFIDSKQDHPERVVLRESPASRRVIAWLLIPLGLAGCGVGILGLAAQGAGLLIGAGLAFLCAGILVLTQFRNPPTLTFDNRAGALLVAAEAAGTGSASAKLPYAEIAGFDVHRRIVATAGRSRSTQYTCSMVRKDGARWALMTTHNRADAEALRARLQERVKLGDAKPAEVSAAEPPSFVEVLQTSEATILRWKKRVSIAGSLLVIGVIGGFGVIGWGLGPFAGAFVSWLIVAAVGLVELLVILATIGGLRTYQRVELGGGMLRYREEGSLLPWGAFEKPLGEIATALFQFSPDEKAPMLLIIDRAQQEQLRALGTEREPDPMRMAGLLFSLRRIGLGEMGLDDLLRLERFLEAEIDKRR